MLDIETDFSVAVTYGIETNMHYRIHKIYIVNVCARLAYVGCE